MYRVLRSKYLIFILSFYLLLTTFYLIPNVSAHGTGLPPFFKINGVLSPTYPPTSARIGASLVNLPQDIAPANYLVNTPIKFVVDTSLLAMVIPQQALDQTSYAWDFGDGSSGSGTVNTHTYSKIGSFILTVTADYHQPDISPQLIESVLINILPSSNYQLPKAVLKINGQIPQSGVNQNLDLNNPVTFNALSSSAPSSKIISYSIDFDDGQSSNQPVVSHQYHLPQYFASVILRVRDQNGFYSDTAVNIRDTDSQTTSSPVSNNTPKVIGAILLLGLVLTAAIVVDKKLR